MQTAVLLPDDIETPDLQKARAMLIRLAMRHVPPEYRWRRKIERAALGVVKYVFRKPVDAARLTHANVQVFKMVCTAIDRRDETDISLCASRALTVYMVHADRSLHSLRNVRMYATQHGIYHALHGPLGTIAQAWLLLCRRTLIYPSSDD